MTEREKELLDQARNGSMDAFVALFEPWRPTVHAMTCRMVGEDDAYDVTMAVFLKAWQALPRFQARSSLRTWLYRIAHNCAIDHLRMRALRQPPAVLGDATERAEVPDESTKSPDREVAEAEQAAQVRQVLDRLPAEQKTAMVLRYMEGLSYLEIAKVTGISIGTVMSRLFNARRKLRGFLEETGGRPE